MNFEFPEWHRLHKQKDKATLSSAADKSGLPPGSLVHIGEKHATSSRISVIQYNDHAINECEIKTIAELQQLHSDESITWVNIDGLSNARIIEDIGAQLNIHPLILEDILSTHQRPKLEEYDDYLYLVVKSINVNDNNALEMQYEQISILLLTNYVITFKEKAEDIFRPVRYRLQNNKDRLRQNGSDYLTYVLLDTIVDEYFVIEDHLDEIIDPLEDSLLTNPDQKALQIIQHLRRELITMKRSISPLRELLSTIQHTDTGLIHEKTLRYYGDVHDHVLRVTDSMDSYRERIAVIQDVYLSSISNKMNETMKILTIFAAIFIPLTFLAGIYGMNFEYMPELKWRWAYPVLWLVFITISIGLILYFKKKKWL
ncbi:magnesium/cobalt transporter CorA [Nitrosomonas sp.]|uniref:magnesium/cobalt transporter CorA n=1 Tax=Nitrosomonas sp. TaxID=42353 RepID=UPI001D771750|nr:magnesium/cobalt transporter CorA [Nitrosomonas sp.]MCB1948237.1 magnesium/cobalt transporter CorA [Nitrosomonas sp.]MCP5243326.1 magnesium/cobalt transporter CorA [Burkholderiales bacterium]MDR4515036.1 magnesium/cobalt transporter CorA [Nitrosomonas sp.]